MHERERRYKRVHLSAKLVMGLLFNAQRIPDSDRIRVITATGVPDDVEIAAVGWDEFSGCFVLRLWHASFDVVPDAHPIPEATITCTAEELEIVPKDRPRGREFI